MAFLSDDRAELDRAAAAGCGTTIDLRETPLPSALERLVGPDAGTREAS